MIRNVRGVSIIMPTYNEAGNIAGLIIDAANAVKGEGIQHVEVIVVDDDSPDGTWRIAGAVRCPSATVRVLRRVDDHGLTASLRDGIAAASHDIVVWLDCDFSHPPERIPQMLYMLDQGYDAAINSRYVVGGGEDRAGKGGRLQRWLSGLLNWSVRFMLYPYFADYTSGFIAIRREVVSEVGLRGDYGEYFVDLVFRLLRKGYRVCELPYFCMPRRSGESKTGRGLRDYLRRGRKYFRTVATLRVEAILNRA